MKHQDKTKAQLIAENGELRQRLAVLEGIDSERRRAEEETAKSRAILTAAIECLPFDFFALDREGRCILQNALSRKYYGDALGKTAEEVCPDTHVRPGWIDGARRALAGKRVEGAMELIVGGERRCFSCFMVPIQSGGTLHGALGVNVDITQRKRGEEVLRQSEERYRALAESTKDIIYILNRQGTLLYANQAASQSIGLPSSELAGKRQTDLFPPEMAQIHMERIERVFATGETLEEDELLRFGQEPVWFHVRLLPLRDEAGKIISTMGVCHNITERKRAEEALKKAYDDLEEKVRGRTAELQEVNKRLAEEVKERRQAEQRHALAAEVGKVGLYDWDVRGQKLLWTPGLLRILGYEPKETGMTAHDFKEWTDRVHPEDLPWVEERIRRSMEERASYHAEYRLLWPDGTLRWVESLGQWLCNGNVLRMVGTLTDITGRRQAQEALSKSENQFRAFVTASSDVVYCMSPDWTEMRRLQGRESIPDTTSPSRTWLDKYIDPADQPQVLTVINEAIRTKSVFELEHRVLRVDGTLGWIFSRAVPLLDDNGRIVEWFGAASDITARKQAQDALQKSEERYRTVVEDQTEMINRFRADGTLTFVNDVFCRFFGKTSQELLGSKWHPNALPEDLPMIEDKLSSLSPINRVVVIENRVFSGQGEVRWMQFVNRGFFDEKGQLTEVQAVGRDITDRKLAEQAASREQRTLEHMLRASDHERQLIAYDIHDGLAQYLTGAVMQFDASHRLRTANPKDAAKNYAAGMMMVRQGLAEARRLISGVRPPILDESGIVAAIAHLVYEHRGRTGPKIEFRSKVEFGRLAATLENCIYRIVQEGLSNAWKHSQSKKVGIGLVQRGDQVRIAIRDQGIGFDPHNVGESCFGLDGIRERARLLGGRATIDSKPGKGTRIVVTLPVVLPKENGE